MIKNLKRQKLRLFYIEDGKERIGSNSYLRGDCSYLRGNCSGLSGDCSGLSGNCSGLSGNCSDCKISDDERKSGINIEDLVVEEIKGEGK